MSCLLSLLVEVIKIQQIMPAFELLNRWEFGSVLMYMYTTILFVCRLDVVSSQAPCHCYREVLGRAPANTSIRQQQPPNSLAISFLYDGQEKNIVLKCVNATGKISTPRQVSTPIVFLLKKWILSVGL